MKSKLLIITGHFAIWILLIALPLMFNGRALANIMPGNKTFVFGPFLFFNFLMIGLFYLNYFVLIPQLLFKNKYFLYFLSFGLLFLIMSFIPLLGRLFEGGPPPPMPMRPMLGRDRSILSILNTNSFLMFSAVFTSSIALRMYSRLLFLEKEKAEATLSYLRSQVNPHFLFNTLNSIYAVTMKTEPKGAEMISRLSEMMRYNMREAHMGKVELKHELENLSNYIELQRVRLTDNVKLSYTCISETKGKQIAPLLLLPFVENAFKYGVNSQTDSEIEIDIQLIDDVFSFKVRNTIVPVKRLETEGGIGIENTKNRLDLMYPDRSTISIKSNPEFFEVTLKIILT